MWQDPIVEEVRKIRHQIEEEYNHDSHAYYQHIIQLQTTWSDRLVRRQPKKALQQDIKVG